MCAFITETEMLHTHTCAHVQLNRTRSLRNHHSVCCAATRCASWRVIGRIPSRAGLFVHVRRDLVWCACSMSNVWWGLYNSCALLFVFPQSQRDMLRFCAVNSVVPQCEFMELSCVEKAMQKVCYPHTIGCSHALILLAKVCCNTARYRMVLSVDADCVLWQTTAQSSKSWMTHCTQRILVLLQVYTC